MTRRTNKRYSRRTKRGGLLSNLGPYGKKSSKMDQKGVHKIAKGNRTKIESSEDVRGCGITSWGKQRKKKSCESGKWTERGCYWLDPAESCYDIEEPMDWEDLEEKGLSKKIMKKAKKITKKAKQRYKKLKGRSDYQTSESLKSSKSSSKSKSRSSRGKKRSSRSSSKSSTR